MRLMTYNILDGAQERLDDVLAVVADRSPDVLALQECNGFDEAGGARLRQVEHALGMRGLLARSDSGYHVALFCRPHLLPTEIPQPQGLTRAAACARLQGELGELEVVSLHLDPHDAASRVGEIGRVLQSLSFTCPAVLMGDFNAISSFDVKALAPQAWPQRYRDRHGCTEQGIDTRALDQLSERGFCDVASVRTEALRMTRPTRLYADLDLPSQRLDYIWVSAELCGHLREAGVVDDERSQRASDHLPLWVDVGP